MPIIKPVTDLSNYREVLRDVAVGQPVFLTRNGAGRYAVLDIDEYREYEKMKAMNRLMAELEKARLDADKNGWIPGEEVFKSIEEEFDV